MKDELDRMMGIIKDYKTGYGGVTDSLVRKELEIFAKDYHTERLALLDVSSQKELLSGYASYIHEKMNFLDAHSPHIYIDEYLDTL